MPKPDYRPRVCDYEGSTYRTDFWEGKGRNYEDRVERIALRRLLPPQGGQRLLELGAGFGRITDEYDGYEQVVLVDYSLSQLRDAQEYLGKSSRYLYVAADAYALPFRPGSFDAVTIVRVLHHMADVPAALQQVRRTLITGGTLILEYANKRNAKAIYRYARGKQSWNPNDLEPVEFVELNFDFHPDYVKAQLAAAGFTMNRSIPVSFFRLGVLKNTMPTELLAGMDGLLQLTGLHYTPSIFTRNTAVGASPNNLKTTSLFVCPDDGGELTRIGDMLTCDTCVKRWAIRDGIYDFKAPLDEE
jgi:SAM-dependent methyltransferase